MKIFKKLPFKKKEKIINIDLTNSIMDRYEEIGKLVKEARIKENFSIEELSLLSKIPKNTIESIENNLENFRPKYPFIRSILFKLEECLSLSKNSLVGLVISEKRTSKKDKGALILKKLDFINTRVGTVFYFLSLILIIFVLKRYFISNVSIIEIQNIEERINK